jgi:hypothetical protein
VTDANRNRMGRRWIRRETGLEGEECWHLCPVQAKEVFRNRNRTNHIQRKSNRIQDLAFSGHMAEPTKRKTPAGDLHRSSGGTIGKPHPPVAKVTGFTLLLEKRNPSLSSQPSSQSSPRKRHRKLFRRLKVSNAMLLAVCKTGERRGEL